MITKTEEYKLAVELRKQGLSLNDIKKRVPVAKSTLSLWLREVDLSNKQKQALTEKKRSSALRGALRRRTDRIASTKSIKDASRKEIGKLSDREIWLIGSALYWAEGSKQKDTNVSQVTAFANSDPNMLKLFLTWLEKFVGIPYGAIKLEIYTHEGYSGEKALAHWSKILRCPESKFKNVYFKKGNPKTKRKNVGENYFGLVRISVSRSTNLNRKITGWIEGIVDNCEVV